jgi:hypothetical protein
LLIVAVKDQEVRPVDKKSGRKDRKNGILLGALMVQEIS